MSVLGQLGALDIDTNGQVDEALQRIAEEEVRAKSIMFRLVFMFSLCSRRKSTRSWSPFWPSSAR